MTKTFSSPNWGQAFRMYNNTTAWGYDPEYKQKDDIHIVSWKIKDNKIKEKKQA